MSTLERAIEIATEAHCGQFDKTGNGYIAHPLCVMAAARPPKRRLSAYCTMLVESAYRNERVAFLYSGEKFYVPENLYIIGMMNTACRTRIIDKLKSL